MILTTRKLHLLLFIGLFCMKKSNCYVFNNGSVILAGSHSDIANQTATRNTPFWKKSNLGEKAGQGDYHHYELNPDEGKGESFLQDRSKLIASDPQRTRKNLYIGGLFEMTNSSEQTSDGHSDLLYSALLAMEDINRKEIVPGYQLKMVRKKTRCDVGHGSKAFYDLLYSTEQLVMLIDATCSEVAGMVGQTAPYNNLVMVTSRATSPELSDREKYPTLYRLAPTYSSRNPARIMFIRHFGWDTVATLYDSVDTFSLGVDDMNKVFEKDNISLSMTAAFRSVDADGGFDLHSKMQALQECGARIIIGSFNEKAGRQVFCEAYHMGLYGPRYVWMLLGSYTPMWWEHGEVKNCTHKQLAEALEGYFAVDSLNEIIDGGTSLANLTTDEFFKKYKELNTTSPPSVYAPISYDSVWAIALTLRNTLTSTQWSQNMSRTLDTFSYEDNNNDLQRVFSDEMDKLDFMGVSGPVSFDGPNRRSISVLEQNQGGEHVRIAVLYPETDTLEFNCQRCKSIKWQDGIVPRDKYTVIVRLEHIDSTAFITVCSVCLCGITMASVFLGFNLYHRRIKYIKLSSPKLNNVAVVGCILVYTAVILQGLDDATLKQNLFKVICTLRAFFLSSGFSLAFGAMFAKTFRVHQILMRAQSGLIKRKMLKDNRLLLLVGALLFVDSVIVTLWVVIDPMDRNVTNYTAEQSTIDPDLLYIPQLASCQSNHQNKWLGTFYAYKGLLLLFGVYMAWGTRHVKIPILNDSQYIGLNIYNVVLTSITVVALSSLLSDKPTLSYAVVSALIIVSTSGMLGLLFLPKIYAIVQHKGSPVVTTSGLKVAANTRRFAVDEKKEQQYRAEVQNRVYKRELRQLDQEIRRLETILDNPSQAYSDVADHLYLISKSNGTSTSNSVCKKNAICLERDQSTIDKEDMTTELTELASSNFETVYTGKKVCHAHEPDITEHIGHGEQVTSFESYDNTTPIMLGTNKANIWDSFVEPPICYHHNRKKSRNDGSLEERRSLLSQDICDVLDESKNSDEWPTRCRPGHVADDTLSPNSGLSGNSELEAKTNNKDVSKAESESNMPDHSPTISVSPTATENKTQLRHIQRQLSKIQRELEELGELEIQVNKV